MSIEEQSVRSLAQLMGVEILPMSTVVFDAFVCTMHAPKGQMLRVVPPGFVDQFVLDLAYVSWGDALESLKGTTKV